MLTLLVASVAAQFDETDLPEDVQAEAESQSSLELCARYLAAQYPDAAPARLKTYCRSIRADAVAAAKPRPVLALNLREEVKMKFENLKPEVQARLQNLAQNKLEKLGELEEAQLEKLRYMNQARVKNIADEADVGAELRAYRLKQVAQKADLFRARTVNNYQELKQKYQTALRAYQQTRERLSDECGAFREAVDGGDEDAAMEHAKACLTNTADTVIHMLETLEAKVMENDDLTEEEVEAILADLNIESKIETMEQAKADVEAAQTKEEIKEAGRVILNAWNRMKHHVRLHAELVVKARVMDVYKRVDFLQLKLERVLAELEEDYDVSDLQEMLKESAELIEDAKEKVREGVELFKEAKQLIDDGADQEDIDAKIEEAKATIREAHELFKQAHELIKDVIEGIRDLSGSLDIVTEVTEEDLTVIVDTETSYAEPQTEDESGEDENEPGDIDDVNLAPEIDDGTDEAKGPDDDNGNSG